MGVFDDIVAAVGQLVNFGLWPMRAEAGQTLRAKAPVAQAPDQLDRQMGERWQGPYLKPGTQLVDPWGNRLRYELADATTGTGTSGETSGGLPYKLFSIGPDGQPDTEDDVKLHAEAGEPGAPTGTGNTPSGNP